MGVSGAALATVLSQGISALLMILYCLRHMPFLKLQKKHLYIHRNAVSQILQYSLLTCIQQSIMNFGILMVQGLVNSFGVTVMAAFAAAVKIDAFAYMPVQDFGNAFKNKYYIMLLVLIFFMYAGYLGMYGAMQYYYT